MTGADDLSHYGGGRNPQTSGAIACNNANSSSPQFSNLWQTLYTGIDRANTFLENIDKSKDISDKIAPAVHSRSTFHARLLLLHTGTRLGRRSLQDNFHQ